jgi:hypothetical protein
LTLRIGITHEVARSCRERVLPRERSPQDPCCKSRRARREDSLDRKNANARIELNAAFLKFEFADRTLAPLFHQVLEGENPPSANIF